jgi:hypothetical protein
MGQLRRIGWLVRLVRLLVRFPADEVDERTGRLRVADMLVAAVWSRHLPLPVSYGDLRLRKGQPDATRQKIQLRRRDSAHRDEGHDVRRFIGLSLRGDADPVKPPSEGQRTTMPSSSRMASAIS